VKQVQQVLLLPVRPQGQEQQPAQVLQKKLYQQQRKQTSQLKNLTCVNHEECQRLTKNGQFLLKDPYLPEVLEQVQGPELVQLLQVQQQIWAVQKWHHHSLELPWQVSRNCCASIRRKSFSRLHRQ
jgi:hypothetical protein